MQNLQILNNIFFISTDMAKINIEAVHHYLCNESYWAKNIPLYTVQKSIKESLCFGVYKKEGETAFTQAGFARVITDKATFAYLADVFILEQYRGMGLSKWLMQEIMEHEELQGLRAWMLATKDAHGLYEQFGFKRLENTERIMRLSAFESYPAIPN